MIWGTCSPRTKMSPLKSFSVGAIFGAAVTGTIEVLGILAMKQAAEEESERKSKRIPIELDEANQEKGQKRICFHKTTCLDDSKDVRWDFSFASVDASLRNGLFRHAGWQENATASKNKAISTSQAWLFFVKDVPVRSLPSSRADFTPCDSFMQRAHLEFIYNKFKRNKLNWVSTIFTTARKSISVTICQSRGYSRWSVACLDGIAPYPLGSCFAVSLLHKTIEIIWCGRNRETTRLTNS